MASLKCNARRSAAVLGACAVGISSLSAQSPLGQYSGYSVAGKAVTVSAAPASVRFIFYTPDILRVDFLPSSGAVPDSSFVVVRDTSASVPVTLIETDSSLAISSPSLTVLCSKSPLRFSFLDASGRRLVGEPASGGLSTDGASRWAVFDLPANEHFYGTGERGTGLDRRGQAFDSYNTQVYGYHGAVPTMKVNVPYLASSNGYALYIDNTWRGRFDLGSSDPDRFWYIAEGGELTYYLIASPTLAGQLERYTWLTGRQPLPPRWALGFIQSKFGYQNEGEARTVVTTMRQRHIPCDALVLDLYWFEHMGNLAWNSTRFPSPSVMMSDFLAQGIRTLVITEPYVVQPSPNYGVAAANGFLGRSTTGQPYVLNNWWSCGCPAGLVDFTNPAAGAWWWSLHPSFMGSTMGGLWTDLGEPERHPDDMVHHLGPAPRVHNIHNLLWAKILADGFRDTWPDRRMLNLTRSGFAGIQRYGAITWSGDVGKSFDALAVQLPIILGMGMSGLAYHNSDIGGFCCGTTSAELYTRWMQFGALCPVMRAHGSGQPTEPWAFGSATEAIVRSFIELRYRLLPYLYTLASENTASGIPLLRPLIMEAPDDPRFRNESGSYLLGDALLVSPVVQDGQRSKTILLPPGEWVDFWTDTLLQGGQPVTRETPLERIPLLVRAGSIVPMGPLMQHTGERPLDTLFLATYPSRDRVARFTLYEDDGVSLRYTDGQSATTVFEQRTMTADTGTSLAFTLGASEGMFEGKLQRRVVLIDCHGIGSAPVVVLKDGVALPQRVSYEEMRANGDGFYHDPSGRRLFIHLPLSTDSSCVVLAQSLTLSAGTPREGGRADDFLLAQNYPNPFNPVAKFEFRIAESCHANITVYDLLGRKVATLVDREMSAGLHTAGFDASGLPSGMYLYRLTAGNRTAVRKMMILR